MRTFLACIIVVVLSDVFCASLPLPSNLQAEGSRFDSAIAGHERTRDVAHMKNTQIRRERKLSSLKKYLEQQNGVERAMRDAHVRVNGEARDRRQILRSSLDLVEAPMEILNAERTKRDAIRPIVKRSFSKSGRMRVRITNMDGSIRSFRKRRSQ
jgi:hypothetical protein